MTNGYSNVRMARFTWLTALRTWETLANKEENDV
jgi:hypothetical protein